MPDPSTRSHFDQGDSASSDSAQLEDAPQHQRLPRVLGLFDATMIVVGSIIGSGIFLKVSAVDSALQPYGFGTIMATWFFVGAITLCGALALAELGAMFPHAGGPYLYIRETFGRLPAFLWGWTEFWVVRTGSVGALACATVLYFNELVPMTAFGQTALAIAIIVGLSIVNLFSTKAGAAVQSIATVSKVAFLAALIVLPFIFRAVDTENIQPIWSMPTDANAASSFWKVLGIAMIAVLWPYDGWINLGPVAEDIRDPRKNVPRAMAIGLGIVIIVYMGANLSYHLVLPIEHLASSGTVAADVFQAMFGPIGAKIAAMGVMISTFGATNSNMITGPRIYLAIARDGLVPAWFHRIHHRFLTPANTIVVQALWTVVLVVYFSIWNASPSQPSSLIGEPPATNAASQMSSSVTHSRQIKQAFDKLTDSVICAGLIFYSLAVSAVYVLRWRRPDMERPYKTWGYPFTPALLLVAYLGAFVSLLIEQWAETMSVLALIAAGVAYFYIATAVRRRISSVPS